MHQAFPSGDNHAFSLIAVIPIGFPSLNISDWKLLLTGHEEKSRRGEFYLIQSKTPLLWASATRRLTSSE
jgi:hypothetical protein